MWRGYIFLFLVCDQMRGQVRDLKNKQADPDILHRVVEREKYGATRRIGCMWIEESS